MIRSLTNLFRVQLPIWLVTPLLGLAVFSGLGGGFVAAQVLTPPTNCPESSEICDQFGVFWQTWGLAKDHFVDPQAARSERMIQGAVQGMLDSLGDQGHTRFLSADEARQWKESLRGEFEGIGVYIDVRDGKTIIVAPMEGSPAEQAGLRAGDVIIKVNGESTSGWSVQELSSRVRGPRDTNVTVTVQREGVADPIDVVVVRSKIEVPNVNWTMLANQVALVRLNSFGQRAADEMKEALVEAQNQGARAIVLDLRDNPGGLVHEAVAIASQFLPGDTTVLLEEDRSGQRIPSKTSQGGVALTIPMTVLVNGNTASSAEILAGALQDAGRTQVIGTPTIGTGTVLNPYNLDGGAQLLLGTSQWLTPNGRLIRNQGIAPDVRVALPENAQQLVPSDAANLPADALLQNPDTQLVRALQLLEVAIQR